MITSYDSIKNLGLQRGGGGFKGTPGPPLSPPSGYALVLQVTPFVYKNVNEFVVELRWPKGLSSRAPYSQKPMLE